MTKEDLELATECLTEIRRFKSMGRQGGWIFRKRNKIYQLMEGKIKTWIRSICFKRSYHLEPQRLTSLSFEIFSHVLEGFDPEKCTLEKFWANFHCLVKWELYRHFKIWEANKILDTKEDPDQIPGPVREPSFETDFQRFIDGIKSSELREQVKRTLNGDYEKFGGNVYLFQKQRQCRMWVHELLLFFSNREVVS